MSRTTTASGLEHDQRWLTVDSPALNDLLKFIVDGLIFEPIYRVFLCNIYHWYYPYLFIGALNNDISEGPWDLAADKLAHAFTHDPPMFCKYKPRFLQIQRAFAYGPISFSVVNEAIKQLSLIYNDKYAETFDAAYLHSYLLENFKLPHRVIPQDNVWTRAPVQIYTQSLTLSRRGLPSYCRLHSLHSLSFSFDLLCSQLSPQGACLAFRNTYLKLSTITILIVDNLVLEWLLLQPRMGL